MKREDAGASGRILTVAALADELAAAQGPARRVIAVAGAPGSGKSTLADHLVEALGGRVEAAVLPMDGFHYDDTVLEARGHRARKGAPHTFDVDGFAALLARLAADDGREVAVPVFDRSIEIARAGARIIGPEVRLIVVEGNYVLLGDPGWADLRRHFDLTVFLDVPEPVLAARLQDRWAGYGMTPDQIREKLEGNDLPNCRRVITDSLTADVIVRNG